MSNSIPPDDLAWLRQCAAVDGNTYDRVLLHLLERVEALEAAQHRPHRGKLDRLIALGRDDDAPTLQPTLPAAPAGGLVEMVLRELPAGTDLSCARAVIRVVQLWAGQLGLQRTERKLREEADR